MEPFVQIVKANYSASKPIHLIGETLSVPNLQEGQRITAISAYRIVRNRVVVWFETQPTSDPVPPTIPLEGMQLIQWSHPIAGIEKMDGDTTDDLHQVGPYWYHTYRLQRMERQNDHLIISAWALPVVASVSNKTRIAV